jgi:hypothetical protein
VTSDLGSADARERRENLLDARREGIAGARTEGKITAAWAERLEGLVATVKRRHDRERRPRIFLSYPHTASGHAELVRGKLEPYYDLDEYQEQDFTVIAETVRDKIEDADFFIAIWHHDDTLRMSDDRFGISPWMHFEYGIAFQAQKPAIVVHSAKLAERIWKAVNPGVSHPEYSDLNFASHTVPRIVKYCKKHFRLGPLAEPE